MDGSGCDAIDGNPDFYGLGIRLGVYLQVLSTWVTNTLNEDAVADTHAANSIFLLAIVVSVASAAANRDIRPVEVWIMVQICLMFPLTIMSVFGARTNFLTPASIDSLVERFKALSSVINIRLDPQAAGVEVRFKATYALVHDSAEVVIRDEIVEQVVRKQCAPEADAEFGLWLGLGYIPIPIPDFSLSFKALSLVKHFTLTWLSAMWRALIVAALAATNLWFWFSYWDQSPCSYSIFILAPRDPSGALAIFFKVGATSLAAAAAVPLLINASFALMAVRYASDLMLGRQGTPSVTELAKAIIFFATKNKVPVKKEANAEHRKIEYDIRMTSAPGTVAQMGVSHETHHAISKIKKPEDVESSLPTEQGSQSQIPSPREGAGSTINDDIQPVAGGLPIRAREEERGRTSIPAKSRLTKVQYYQIICLVHHVVILLVAAYFILSIELTILWNGIAGVHTVTSTGQLIPLIIGVVSSVRATQEVVLGVLRKNMNVDDDMDFSVSMGFETGQGMRLIRRQPAGPPEVIKTGRIVWEGPTPDVPTTPAMPTG